MRKSAILSILIDTQEPYQKIEITLGRHREEILILLTASVSIQHYDLCDLGRVDRILQIPRMDRVETVGIQRIIKIHRIECRLLIKAVITIQQLIEHLPGQVRILVVVNEHRIPLLKHLPDEMAIDSSRLTAAGNSQDHHCPLRRHHIAVPVVKFAIILVLDGNVHTIAVLDEFLTLRKRIPVLHKIGIETPILPAKQHSPDCEQDISDNRT